ncbi:arylesterase [Desulfonema ishimotonii]|uniref:Arylesterase n=1 Tax=Desulfonema ishimotonii TaxID=45657 RepID=A0A401G3P2_9BACT|nr:arylesterase [Desulfonema ishimotonii]GBC63850.1 arylesterase [Desulfonema ishimotonii]
MKKALIPILLCMGLFLGWRIFSPDAYEIRNTTPSGENIICFGDSLTYGTGASEGMDYPARLSEMLGSDVINAGVPGDTTDMALRRLEADVLSRSPRIVLITLGGNDLRNGISKKQAFRNLGHIVAAIQEQGALVVIGGISIPFWGRGFGDAYETLARETGAVLIPNIFEGIMGNSGRMSDSIHPNDAGYALMAENFHAALSPYIR